MKIRKHLRHWVCSRSEHTTGCLLDYNYFKNCYDVNRFKQIKSGWYYLKAIQQINFTRYLDWEGKTAMFFVVEGE